MFFFFLRAAVGAVLQPYHTCQIALCTSFVVLVSWQINDDDDDDVGQSSLPEFTSNYNTKRKTTEYY